MRSTSTACATGDGVNTEDDEYYPLKVCCDITAGTDQDGDGLMDDWENFGFDADGDGTVDINLPLMGASRRTRISVSSSTTRPLDRRRVLESPR